MSTKQRDAANVFKGETTFQEDYVLRVIVFQRYELLPAGRTLGSTVYCWQLNNLKTSLRHKRLELVYGKGIVTRHVINYPSKFTES